MASVRFENVTKEFGGVRAVKGLDLEISDGEFCVFVGPSGCGKTTALRMLAGLETPTSGRILLEGRNVAFEKPMDRNIAMVFQNYALYPHMTVAQNMGFSLRMQKVPADEISRRVSSAARMLEVEDLLDRLPRQLSGGQRQRVAVGRAIVRNPHVFLFDEPLSNLDAKLRNAARIELKQLQTRLGTTTVYVTHDQVEAMTMADRIVLMNDGCVLQVGRPMDLYSNPASTFVATFLGSPPMNLLSARVVETPSDSAKIDLGGATFMMPVDLPAGMEILVGIRPEQVLIGSERSDGPTLTVGVAQIEELGGETLLHTERNGSRIVVKTGAYAGIREREVIPIHFPASAIHIFDKLEGRRLQ